MKTSALCLIEIYTSDACHQAPIQYKDVVLPI